jgi:hypothetical protein
MRRYESMSRDQIHLAIAQEREILAAIEKYQAYLASGNGNPKDELSRLQLQLSNSRSAFDTSTQPPPTEMLRMVVASFRSCCKMHGLKTSQHDYQPRPAK